MGQGTSTEKQAITGDKKTQPSASTLPRSIRGVFKTDHKAIADGPPDDAETSTRKSYGSVSQRERSNTPRR
ncbi:MAG: hypothetical protein CMF50_10500 [Legionellales bacterium]|nr:hypothetical protein [Legionellales bacterium]